MRRTLGRWAAAAAIVALALPLAPAGGQDVAACQHGVTGPIGVDGATAGGVNIHLGGNVTWCSAAAIEANKDVADGTDYPLRQTAGGPSQNPVSNAITVRRLLQLALADPSSVTFIEVPRTDSSWSTLEGADITDPSRYENGLLPIVWIDGSATRYLRPLRDDSDTNGKDQVSAPDGAALDLFARTGPLLHVEASASDLTPSAGTQVTFTAQTSNASASDGTLSYAWTFGDGTQGSGASPPAHVFPKTGTYEVLVTVSASGDDAGGSAEPLYVTVGSPSPSGHDPNPGGGSGSPQKPPIGPHKSRGTVPTAKPGSGRQGAIQDAGSAGGNPQPDATGGTAPPTDPGQRGARKHVTPLGATPTPSPGSAPSDTPSPAPTHLPTAIHARSHAQHRARRRAGRPARSEQPISGRLIAGLVPLAPPRTRRVPALRLAEANAPAARAGADSSPWAAVLAAGVAAALLGAGAARELLVRRRLLAGV